LHLRLKAEQSGNHANHFDECKENANLRTERIDLVVGISPRFFTLVNVFIRNFIGSDFTRTFEEKGGLTGFVSEGLFKHVILHTELDCHARNFHIFYGEVMAFYLPFQPFSIFSTSLQKGDWHPVPCAPASKHVESDSTLTQTSQERQVVSIWQINKPLAEDIRKILENFSAHL
jgi:hypothetical protein